MALKIVTGGTTGAADGTLVSSGNKLTFSALNTAINAHIRCDDGYWSSDQGFTLPAEVEVSFDGGSTWLGSGTNPNTAPEIEDVNYPIKLRQTTSSASTSGSFTTDGSYTAITALSDVSGLSATPGDTQVALSWSAVTNRTYYNVQRATDSGFTANLVTLTSTWTATTLSDTGLTNGTTYYYRVKAVGTGRYSDSANWATTSATPASSFTDNFSSLDTTSTWVAVTTGSGSVAASGGKAVISKPAQTDKASLVAKAQSIATSSTKTITALIDVSSWGGAFNQIGALQLVRKTSAPSSGDTHDTSYVPFAVEFFNDGGTPYQVRGRYRSSGGSDLYYDNSNAWTASPSGVYFDLPSGDTAQYQVVIELDATSGVRAKLKSSNGATTHWTTAYVSWANLGGSGSNLWVAFAAHQWQLTSSAAFAGTMSVDSVTIA